MRTPLVAAAVLVAGALVGVTGSANAAGESVNIWLTTTSDAGGRTVTRGLQQQAPVAFAPSSPAGNQTVNVNENVTYQQFEGAGASFTDTTAWLMRGSGALSEATRNDTMRRLFDPITGAGITFLRNPMGASDLARFSYTYDDTCCDLNDFSLNRDADVLALTKQAKALNPNVKVMASPWTAPPWMKDSNSFNQGWLRSEYYPMYAQYFVKYIQGYAAQGVKIDYVTVQNEPTCCGGYPSMQWNGEGLRYFTSNHLFPAFRAAGITTKTLILDWNWDQWDAFGAPQMNDPGIRNDPLFGGIAWHGYGGNVATQTAVHNQWPSVNAYMTEHSGGNWIGNQQTEDMLNLVDYTRNWDKSWIKWSLALDQHQGPHNGGCDICTGLITVQNGGSRHGQVDYTVEYYTMGHVTKFVKPGAYRIDTNSGSAVPNVAWKNPDGTKALIAYNTTGGSQAVKVNWGGQSFTYTLPTKTSATFTWGGTPAPIGGTITGLAGKCVDVAGANPANGTTVQLYTCNGTAAQQWTRTGGEFRALGKCLDVAGGSSADGTRVQLYGCNGTAAQQWTRTGDTLRALGKCLDVTGNNPADRTPLQLWSCTGGANQKWSVP